MSRNGRKAGQTAVPKEDTRRNALPVTEDVRDVQRRRDLGKVPLKLDSRTVILVRPEDATPEYADRYRARVEGGPPCPKGGRKGRAANLDFSRWNE